MVGEVFREVYFHEYHQQQYQPIWPIQTPSGNTKFGYKKTTMIGGELTTMVMSSPEEEIPIE